MRLAFNGTYPVTRDFGVYDPAYKNYPGSKHPGTDWALPANTQLVANQSGIVTVYNRDSNLKTGRGKEVVISNGNRVTKACHLNRIDVQNGQWIKEGDLIGLSGYTGYVVDNLGRIGTKEGAHLHNELLIDGVYVRLQDNLKKEEPMPNDGDIDNAYLEFNYRKATDEEKKVYREKTFNTGDGLLYGKIFPEVKNLKQKITDLEKEIQTLKEQAQVKYKPIGQLYIQEN